MNRWFFISLCLLATGCNQIPKCYNVVSCDEFVTDSYCIRQGKQAILQMMGEDPGAFPCDAMEEYCDVIEEGDLISASLYHPTKKDLRDAFESINRGMGGFRVKNGMLDLPDLPPVCVVGLSLKEAQERVQEELSKQIEEGEIFLTYKDRSREKVIFLGRVKKNSLPVNGKTRLYDLLAEADLDCNANLFMSYVMRDGRRLAVDLHRLMNEGDLSQNIVMHGGDRIFIAKADDAKVLVMGEVTLPVAIPLYYGYTTLSEAIVQARGIPYTGDRRNIQVIRGSLECPKIYVVSWNQLICLPNEDLLLMPGDTVFVSEKPITQWNRFISQLLPSLGGARDAKSTYKMFFKE